MCFVCVCVFVYRLAKSKSKSKRKSKSNPVFSLRIDKTMFMLFSI